MRVILIILSFLSIPVYSQTYQGSIIRVIDGDTFIFQTKDGSFTVRMQGIDAPEMNQPFSKESADFLNKYLNNAATFIRTGTDKYGRTLGILIVDGVDINMLSLKYGFSWHFKRYSSDSIYDASEKYARENKLGLWGLKNPIPPWEWRKNNYK